MSQKATSLGINWRHERAISDWEAERDFDPSKGSTLEQWQIFRAKFARIGAFCELRTGARRDNGRSSTQKRAGITLPFFDDEVGVEPEEVDRRLEMIRTLLDDAKLTDREREILLRALSGESDRAIGRKLGLSGGWVGQLKHRAMDKLRNALAERGITKRSRRYTGPATL